MHSAPNWLLSSLYSACRQPVNGNATYNFIVFIHGSLLVVVYIVEDFVFSVDSLFSPLFALQGTVLYLF